MKKINNYIAFGLLFNGLFILGNNFNVMPELVKGVLAGLGIGFCVYGALSQKYDVLKIKNYKKKLLKNFFHNSF